MKSTTRSIFVFLLLIACTFYACKDTTTKTELTVNTQIIELSPERAAALAKKIRTEVAAELADGLELSLWASDTLVSDPIAISIAPDGKIFYTKATRQVNSEFDIRGHRNWITASISFQNIEDRRKFLRENFQDDNEESTKHLKDLNEDGVLNWKDLAVEKEQIWFVEDKAGTGIADRAQLYLEDFNEEITDVANGVEFYDGDVYVTCAPDFWKTSDKDGDGVADEVTSLARGFAVHIGFSGHGLSGATVGPDGRLWWGIGDIGANVTDKDGKQWEYPNQGVIARCEPDGSNFEIYSAGLRNTHEFTFDQYGNLITEDNDGDHQGESERLVYLINGSDCGWRTNWQFGKYTDPDNNLYKVWMDEKMFTPRWEEQPAYILPPIVNYVNGPTGFVYNPGTALAEEWYNHFFVAEFRGSPANSPIHAFTLKPDGAGFALDETQIVAKGLLPTGLDFGPDGALYFGDWIDGWDPKSEGRIWKLDVPNGAADALRQETKQLIQADFDKKELTELEKLLAHQDMRVRRKAQFELVKRGGEGYEVLVKTAKSNGNQLARIHGIWGIGQISRQNIDYAKELPSLLTDSDPEIIAQAAKMIGDVRYEKGAADVVAALQNASTERVKLLTTEALGRLEYKDGTQAVIDMTIANGGEDNWLRHAAMIALARMSDAETLAALHTHESAALRTVAVVALRRMKSPEIAQFLKDKNELIVTEAARGINDDLSIEAALPALANVLNESRFKKEALLRRAINANLRVGKDENRDNLLNYIQSNSAPVEMKAEALAALSTWAKPSVTDRVDGRYRGEITRDIAPVKEAMQAVVSKLLQSKQAPIQIASAKAAARLDMQETAPTLYGMLKNNTSKEVRKTALQALADMKASNLNQSLELALSDRESEVRALALEIVPSSGLEEGKSVALFEKILKNGSINEQQSALAALGTLKGEAASGLLGRSFSELVEKKVAPEVQLDIIEAIENQGNNELLAQLENYQGSKPKDDPIAMYREALIGGNQWRGRNIFYRNEAAQCVRCHTIFEHGGNAGPGLAGVADRLSDEKLLESIVAPSATYAAGYEVVILEMNDGESLSGIVESEDDTMLKIKTGKDESMEIDKSKIANRESVPSSMPDMSEILSKREVRDVVAFLKTLKVES